MLPGAEAAMSPGECTPGHRSCHEPKKRPAMDHIKPAHQNEMFEFEMEWHHLRIARTAVEWIAIAAAVAAAGYSLWHVLMH
jgi:hypothetical protein